MKRLPYQYLAWELRSAYEAAGRLPWHARVPAVVLSLALHLVLSPLVTIPAHMRLFWRRLPPPPRRTGGGKS